MIIFPSELRKMRRMRPGAPFCSHLDVCASEELISLGPLAYGFRKATVPFQPRCVDRGVLVWIKHDKAVLYSSKDFKGCCFFFLSFNTIYFHFLYHYWSIIVYLNPLLRPTRVSAPAFSPGSSSTRASRCHCCCLSVLVLPNRSVRGGRWRTSTWAGASS